jgi:hypothetical protein
MSRIKAAAAKKRLKRHQFGMNEGNHQLIHQPVSTPAGWTKMRGKHETQGETKSQ